MNLIIISTALIGVPIFASILLCVYINYFAKPKLNDMGNAQYVNLKNGRRLSYAIYGNTNSNKTIFTFHGFPGSRLEGKFTEFFKNKEIKWIFIDRPGFGRSDYYSERKVIDINNDLLELADHLNINKFMVLGYSGGGPYATAATLLPASRCLAAINLTGIGCADQIPNCIEGMRPLNKLIFAIPDFFAPLISSLMYQQSRNDAEFTPRLLKLLDEKTQFAFNKNQGLKKMLPVALKESFYQGQQGFLEELKIYKYFSKWGFTLEQVQNSSVPYYLLFAENDVNVPISYYNWYKNNIQKANCYLQQNDSHFWYLGENQDKFDELLYNIVKKFQ